MKTPINKPPRSKIIQIIKEDKDKKFMVKQSIKGKWNFFTVEFKKDKFAKQANRINTIAEQIALRNMLNDAGSVESFLSKNATYQNTTEKRTIKYCQTKR